ncbi:MAG TPA: hypothetical protein VGD34_03875 [Kribbella sp.]
MSRSPRGKTAGVLAAAVLVAGMICPAPARAAGDDPTPPEFPSVEKPTDKSGGQPDPDPARWPTVASSVVDAAGDPLPPAWPAPVKG